MSLLNHIQLTPAKKLLTDVENRSVYTLNNCELNVFETYRTSERVELTFHDPVLTSMVRGKKVMYLPGIERFDYFPGETVLAPASTKMVIDFPEARESNPTQCIALTLDKESIGKTVAYLNEFYPRSSQGEHWNIDFHMIHMKNSNSLAEVINKMVQVCTEKSQTKDVIADLTMKELVVRLMQLQYQQQIHDELSEASGPFHELASYIRGNLNDKLDISVLCKKAYMSRTQFFRTFKREYGISPVQFIIKERLKRAKTLLTHSNQTIQQICMETGFDDVNNFIKIFKKSEGTTPGSFRTKLLSGTQDMKH